MLNIDKLNIYNFINFRGSSNRELKMEEQEKNYFNGNEKFNTKEIAEQLKTIARKMPIGIDGAIFSASGYLTKKIDADVFCRTFSTYATPIMQKIQFGNNTDYMQREFSDEIDFIRKILNTTISYRNSEITLNHFNDEIGNITKDYTERKV